MEMCLLYVLFSIDRVADKARNYYILHVDRTLKAFIQVLLDWRCTITLSSKLCKMTAF